MAEDKRINILDYFVLLVKWKKFLLAIVIPIMIVSYLSIYFFIQEQFDSSALIIPTEDSSLGGLASLIGSFDSSLPFSIGSNSNPEMKMFNTIIYSRTNLEKVIEKFDLLKIYELTPDIVDYKEIALKKLANSIKAEETEYGAYELKVRASSPELSAKITNYIVSLLNEKFIELKTEKSRNNRVFFQERVWEINLNLKQAEDTLMLFQKKTGILEPEEQFKGIFNTYSELETDLIAKQIEKSILEKIHDGDSPQLETITLEVDEFENRLRKLKVDGTTNGLIPSLNNLPEKATDYYRLYREVEINSKILEFILPLYEQAKIEEKKNTPILQVIDKAVPPAKKSYPPRVLLTLLVTFSSFFIVFVFILIKENDNLKKSEKIKFIKENLFKWKSYS